MTNLGVLHRGTALKRGMAATAENSLDKSKYTNWCTLCNRGSHLSCSGFRRGNHGIKNKCWCSICIARRKEQKDMSCGRVVCSSCNKDVMQNGWKVKGRVVNIFSKWQQGAVANWIHQQDKSVICKDADAVYPKEGQNAV